MADRKFPGPYVDATRENDPIMKRVPFDTMDIGARSSGMPKSTEARELDIKHVGDQNSKTRG